jgi:hypothetical protein
MRKMVAAMMMMGFGLVGCSGAPEQSEPMPGLTAHIEADELAGTALVIDLDSPLTTEAHVVVKVDDTVLAKVAIEPGVIAHRFPLAIAGNPIVPSVAWDPEGGSFGRPTPVPIPSPTGPATH